MLQPQDLASCTEGLARECSAACEVIVALVSIHRVLPAVPGLGVEGTELVHTISPGCHTL